MRLKHPRDWTLADLYPDVPPEQRKAVWQARKDLLRIMWRIHKRTQEIEDGGPEDELMTRFLNTDQFPEG